MVGRPKEFDEAHALDCAMEVFWSQGYEATSVQDLVDAMGINRGSIYGTFGDKHALFTAAIERYGEMVATKFSRCLEHAASPLAGIRRLLNGMIDRGECCRGCLTTNSIVELAPRDPEVARLASVVLQRMERAFRDALERAQAAGELSSDADLRALSRFLTTTVQGLVVMGKASASRAQMRDSINVAMTAVEHG